jgi:flagellar hook-associated protein 2
LTGDDGESDVSGLVIKYTGSSTGEIGTVKLTLGVAEAYNRMLYNITDSIDGYVSYKQKSLQNTISDYTTQIEEMGKVLERKQETMINRFVAMEALISKFQNQSNWLLGQLSAAESGWR